MNIITISYINFWIDPMNDDYFTKFIQHNIGSVKIISINENPDIIIASCMGKISNIKNSNAKCKIFYYGENLNRFPPYNNQKLLYDTFDLIVGFNDTNLTKKQIKFPLWLIYYKYYNYNENDNILKYIQNKYNENINKKKDKFATLIARHDNGKQRTKISNIVDKYGDIYYPSVFRNNTSKIGNSIQDKINYISTSIYNICPENSSYTNYFTEKIFQAFEGGTIPIYWAINKPELNIINENKYCFCNIYDINELNKNIKHVIENKDYYIKGKIFTDNAHIYINKYYTDLKNAILNKLK